VKKVIVRIKGGLGNQFFCYAEARRLALANNAELVIDDVTGFIRDYQYRRKYELDQFRIPVRKATSHERMEPFERYRRGLAKFIARIRPFYLRNYLEQEGLDFDQRLLDFKVKKSVYLDGYWQSEKYFIDYKDVIFRDFSLLEPNEVPFLEAAKKMESCNSVAVGVRLFEEVSGGNTGCSWVIPNSFYEKAAIHIATRVENPTFFVFCTRDLAVRDKLKLPGNIYYISHDNGYEGAVNNLWLFSRCQHYIISNSTFYWWGAWLANYRSKIVIAPDIKTSGVCAWGFDGLMPDGWALL
jgi:hypothetical protein